MEYHVAKNGEKFGPFIREDVYQRLRSGEFTGQDLGWHEGLTEWQPLAVLLPPPGNVFSVGTALPPSARRQTSGLAVASLVCGILALFTLGISALPAIILGHLALSRINKSAGAVGGRGLARSGLIIGYLFIFLVAVALSGSVMMSSFTRKIVQEREVKTVQAAEKLVQSMREYAKNNNGMLPPTLETLFVEDPTLDSKLVQVPLSTSADQGWKYLGAGLTTDDDGRTVVLTTLKPLSMGKRLQARLDGTVKILARE